MIISFSGDLGSGKSTIAKKLSKELNIPRYYAGQFFREMAAERGVTVAELCELGKTDESIDKETDKRVKRLIEEENDFIVESRTAWYFIPESIKVYLKVDIEEGAKRIFKEYQEGDFRKNEDREMKELREVVVSNKKRMADDVERYKKYYSIDILNMNNYDYIIDTTSLTKEGVLEEVLDCIKKDSRFNK